MCHVIYMYLLMTWDPIKQNRIYEISSETSGPYKDLSVTQFIFVYLYLLILFSVGFVY